MNNSLYPLMALVMLVSLSGCTNMMGGTMAGTKPQYSKNEQVALYQSELAVRYMDIGNNDLAKEKLLEAQNLAPNLPAVQYTTAYFLESTGDYARAEEKYRQAIKLKPRLGESHNNFGAFLCRRARYAEAEQEFLLAVNDQNYTSFADVYENAGQCELLSGDKNSASKYFGLALNYDASRSISLLELAKLNLEAGQAYKADQYFQRYRKVAPATAASLWVGIQIAAKLGRTDAVASYALMLKNTFPKSQELKKFRESQIHIQESHL